MHIPLGEVQSEPERQRVELNYIIHRNRKEHVLKDIIYNKRRKSLPVLPTPIVRECSLALFIC